MTRWDDRDVHDEVEGPLERYLRENPGFAFAAVPGASWPWSQGESALAGPGPRSPYAASPLLDLVRNGPDDLVLSEPADNPDEAEMPPLVGAIRPTPPTLHNRGMGTVPTLFPFRIDLGPYPPQVEPLYFKESSGIPTAVNDFGFVGLGQYGEQHLRELGFYYGDDNLTDGIWNGWFGGLPGVQTVGDFLLNVPAQDQVMRRQLEYLDRRIDNMGLGKYIGTTVHGQFITRAGLRFGAHHSGIGDLEKWLKTGEYEPDAYGAALPDYVELGSDILEDSPWPSTP